MNLFMESILKRREMLREWRIWVDKIATIARSILRDTEVYVIGSIARGNYVGGSDVDIVIVSPNIPNGALSRAGVKALIEKMLDLPYYHPFEIHLLKPEEAIRYLSRVREDVIKIEMEYTCIQYSHLLQHRFPAPYNEEVFSNQR
ncbi:MAG: nucleotidyltransferase domain-containing protein [Ignisphaera sp.]